MKRLRIAFGIAVTVLVASSPAQNSGVFFRVVSPTKTVIKTFRSDGTLVWSNAAVGVTGTLQRATTLYGPSNWTDFAGYTVTSKYMALPTADYLVVDLAAGPSASNYPVSYLKDGGDPLVSGDYISTDGDYDQNGLEAEIKGTLSTKHGLSYFGNYTYTHQEVTRMPVDATGQALQLAVPPKGQYSLGLRWAADRRTNVAFSYTNVGDRLARSGYYALAYPLDGYGYANLTLSRELGAGWNAHASLLNVLDAEYESQPGFPRPGRNYSLSFSHTAKIQ